MMARTADDYAGAFHALLPPGRVWRAEIGSTQAKTLLALSRIWARFDTDAETLLGGSLPGKYPDLLPEWEATLGLANSIDGLTTDQRSAQVLARFIAGGGQSREAMIQFAAAMGFEISITVYAPAQAGIATAGSAIYSDDWAFAWGITVVSNTSGRDPSALIAALEDIIPAETAAFIIS